MSNPTDTTLILNETPVATCYEAIVSCYDAGGKLLGNTGGSVRFGHTVGSTFKGYANKARQMIRRGYYAGATKLSIKLRFVSTYGGEVLETSREFSL